MRTAIFATCRELPDLLPGDLLAAKALEQRGVHVAVGLWDSAAPEFQTSDLVVIRSTWDYHLRSNEFLGWLESLSEQKVVNDPDLLRWNISKRYLLTLAEGGAPLPPTTTVAPKAGAIRDAMESLELEQAIVKPVIGATASGLSRVTLSDELSLARAARALGGEGLVQAWLPAIETVGETSLIFFDGEFSHAVCKRPQDDDFRVQAEFGGRTESVKPRAETIALGESLLKLLPSPPVYARVDLIVEKKQHWLMEMELIEPELFLEFDEGAPERFASALVRALRA